MRSQSFCGKSFLFLLGLAAAAAAAASWCWLGGRAGRSRERAPSRLRSVRGACRPACVSIGYSPVHQPRARVSRELGPADYTWLRLPVRFACFQFDSSRSRLGEMVRTLAGWLRARADSIEPACDQLRARSQISPR